VSQFSVLCQVVSAEQSPPQAQPTPSELAMVVFFVPFSACVVWMSWKWRRDYKQLRRERSDLP